MWSLFTGSFSEFCSKGLNDPGTLIEVILNNKKKQFLIGDISSFGSVMNGDCLLSNDTPILRYKRIWARIIPVNIGTLTK